MSTVWDVLSSDGEVSTSCALGIGWSCAEGGEEEAYTCKQ